MLKASDKSYHLIIPSKEKLPLCLLNNLSIVLVLWPSDPQTGGVRQHQSMSFPLVGFIFLFFESKRNATGVIFSSPTHCGSSQPPLVLGRLLLCLHPGPMSPPILHERPCPAPIFTYLPSVSRTLCSSQPSLFHPLALHLFPVVVCALSLAPHASTFCSSFPWAPAQFFSLEWSHFAPNPWNTSRLHCTFFFLQLSTYLFVCVAKL